MSKAVMISIQPHWCEMIANGEKTIEIRKMRPKMETPFKCYIYCTKPRFEHEDFFALVGKPSFNGGGKVIGKFVCNRIDKINKRGVLNNFDYCYLSLNEWGNDDIEVEIRDIAGSKIPKNELNEYGKAAPVLYAWHISDLIIYDAPRALSEFVPACRYKNDDGTCPSRMVACSYQRYDYNHDGTINLVECGKGIERPPQSWRYVEEYMR